MTIGQLPKPFVNQMGVTGTSHKMKDSAMVQSIFGVALRETIVLLRR